MTLIDGLECLGVDYCGVFIRCLDSHTDPFTAEDPLVSNVMIHFSKSVLMKNQTSWMARE